MTSLQALAAPAEGQVRHLPPHVPHRDELAREFADALLLTRQCQSHRLDPLQLAALAALESRLGEVGAAADGPFWTAEALRDDPSWREVRRLAAAALTSLGAHPDEATAPFGPQPTLTGPRIVLRPFVLTDALDVQRLAGERAIADTTMNVPHPYPDGAAERWIATSHALFAHGEEARFAVTTREDGLVGAVGLRIAPAHRHAELGYWIGRPFWGRGYATEASHLIVQYGFERRGLHRIVARHLTRNPASGRIMVKLGMQHEGREREHVLKWDRFEDLEYYGLLRREYVKPARLG